jgi:hypothetical protein
MNNKSYITIKTTQIDTVNFSEVIEQKANLRYSLDSTEFVCKWVEGSPYMPASIEAVPSADRSDILNQEECLVVMASAEWTDPNAMP